jgi:hypothetical protein
MNELTSELKKRLEGFRYCQITVEGYVLFLGRVGPYLQGRLHISALKAMSRQIEPTDIIAFYNDKQRRFYTKALLDKAEEIAKCKILRECLSI